MIRLVWRSDVHISDKGPSSRTDDWVDTVCDKIVQVGRIAERFGAVAVLDGGDFFDRKSPGQTTHRLVRAIAEAHSGYPCPVYATVGNHDCVYGDVSYLPQQPLGVLFATGVFQPLYNEHEAVFMCEETGLKVRVVGVPYHGAKYDLDRLFPKKGDEDYLVVVAHLLASHAGGQMFEGEDIVKYDTLYEKGDADVFAFGHWHKDQGIDRRGDRYIVNLGSMTRGSIAEDDVHRNPCCALLSFAESGITVARQNLDVLPSSEVFDLEKKEREKANAEQIQAFVDRIRNQGLGKKDVWGRDLIPSLETLVRNLPDVPEQVRERALLYLEQADG